MDRISKLLDRIIGIEKRIDNTEDLYLKNLLKKQVFKLKKIVVESKNYDNNSSLKETNLNTIEKLIRIVESILLDTENNSILSELKSLEKNLEIILKTNKEELSILEKTVEINHIVDELIEIIEILSGKIPD